MADESKAASVARDQEVGVFSFFTPHEFTVRFNQKKHAAELESMREELEKMKVSCLFRACEPGMTE